MFIKTILLIHFCPNGDFHIKLMILDPASPSGQDLVLKEIPKTFQIFEGDLDEGLCLPRCFRAGAAWFNLQKSVGNKV